MPRSDLSEARVIPICMSVSFNQLIGYYILNKISNVNETNRKIDKIGIYFSRYGILQTIPTSQIDETPEFDYFVKWFEKEARTVFKNIKSAQKADFRA